MSTDQTKEARMRALRAGLGDSVRAPATLALIEKLSMIVMPMVEDERDGALEISTIFFALGMVVNALAAAVCEDEADLADSKAVAFELVELALRQQVMYMKLNSKAEFDALAASMASGGKGMH